MNTFTWAQVLEADACEDGIDRWMRSHPDTTANSVISVAEVLQSNGHGDAVWCIRLLDEKVRLRFNLALAYRVRHLMHDQRSMAALVAIEQYLEGQLSREGLDAVSAVAEVAYRYAAAEYAEYATYVLRCRSAAAYVAYTACAHPAGVVVDGVLDAVYADDHLHSDAAADAYDSELDFQVGLLRIMR